MSIRVDYNLWGGTLFKKLPELREAKILMSFHRWTTLLYGNSFALRFVVLLLFVIENFLSSLFPYKKAMGKSIMLFTFTSPSFHHVFVLASRLFLSTLRVSLSLSLSSPVFSIFFNFFLQKYFLHLFLSLFHTPCKYFFSFTSVQSDINNQRENSGKERMKERKITLPGEKQRSHRNVRRKRLKKPKTQQKVRHRG